MVVEDVLKLQDNEQSILNEQTGFNCTVSVTRNDKVVTYHFDDYRVAQAIINLLDNMRFVRRGVMSMSQGTIINIYYKAHYNDGHYNECIHTIEYAHRISRKECEREYKNAPWFISNLIDNPNIIDIEITSADYLNVK